jgi:hypothetical protein
MAETYKLVTISDLLNIPLDRLDVCLRDLAYAVCMAHFVAGCGAKPVMEGIVWTDDGDHSVRVTANGEPLFTLEVRPEGEDD